MNELPLRRLEGFSDGVFAIAITLLVLELAVPRTAEGHLLHSILHLWPSYLAYITSFLTIGVIWLQHSAITSALRAADATLYRLNLLVLLLVSFLPFPTKLLSEFIGHSGPERITAVFYGLTLLALSLALTVFVRYAAENRRLVRDDFDEQTLQAAREYKPALTLYVVGIFLALVAPGAGVITYLVSAIARGLPTRTLRRLLLHR